MRKDNNKGFTFIELILYMAILGIFMVAVVTMVGSTVLTNRKQNATQKLQTQATEVYDTLSNMVMAATDVQVYGSGTVNLASGSTAKAKGSFITVSSDDNYTKHDGQGNLKSKSTDQNVRCYGSVEVVDGEDTSIDFTNYFCYDIADVVSFSGTETSALASNTLIAADCLWVKYSTSSGKVSFCTVAYDDKQNAMYLYRDEVDESVVEDTTASDYDAKLKDWYTYKVRENTKGTLLAKNVDGFYVAVNPDDNSMGLVIKLKNKKTGAEYDVSGVVGLRNSFVLKEHK